MAATLPSNAYVGLGSQGELFHSANYGSYDAGIGSITSHPYQYQTNNYGSYLPDNQPPSSYANEFLRSTQAHANHPTERPPTYNQNPPIQTHNYAPATHKPAIDNHQHVDSTSQHQSMKSVAKLAKSRREMTFRNDNMQHHSVSAENQHQHDASHQPPVSKQQRHQSQPNISQPESGLNSKQTSSVPRHSPGNPVLSKTTNPPPEIKQTKSTQRRADAIKKKEEIRDKKERDGNFPSLNKKSKSKTRSPSDDEQLEKPKPKSHEKKSKSHKSRRDDYQTEDNNTTADEENRDEPPRNKSKKRTAFSDSHHERLPPVRRGHGPPLYDPYYDYPYPIPPPVPPHFRGRHPYYDDHPPYGPYPHTGRFNYHHRPPYEDGYDAPPYVNGHHDHYEGYFDYDKRKGHSKPKKHKDKKEPANDHEPAATGNETEGDEVTKSPRSKQKHKPSKHPHKENEENENDDDSHQRWYHPDYDASHYDDRDALEMWRKERNEYLKKSYKPTVHDVLYAQQFMKSDSYVENQRRRALRDSQGYYFPYKKYTLKDYKDLQKQEANQNPYAPVVHEHPIDRRERAKKRQEYGSNVERQNVDISAAQQKTPREQIPKKPWHLSSGDPNDANKLSKRERAMEYSKVQVTKNRPGKEPKSRPYQPDPTEQYVNSLFPQTNDDEYSADERDDRSNNDDD